MPSYWQLSEFGDAYRKWRVSCRPGPDVMHSVKNWARQVTCQGPSQHAVPISDTDEDFMDWIGDTGVFVTYVVSHRDQHIIVKDIS